MTGEPTWVWLLAKRWESPEGGVSATMVPVGMMATAAEARAALEAERAQWLAEGIPPEAIHLGDDDDESYILQLIDHPTACLTAEKFALGYWTGPGVVFVVPPDIAPAIDLPERS